MLFRSARSRDSHRSPTDGFDGGERVATTKRASWEGLADHPAPQTRQHGTRATKLGAVKAGVHPTAIPALGRRFFPNPSPRPNADQKKSEDRVREKSGRHTPGLRVYRRFGKYCRQLVDFAKRWPGVPAVPKPLTRSGRQVHDIASGSVSEPIAQKR